MYYYSDGNNQLGPLPIDELKGKINRETLVWKEGMPQWIRAAEVQELQGLFPPPLPTQQPEKPIKEPSKEETPPKVSKEETLPTVKEETRPKVITDPANFEDNHYNSTKTNFIIFCIIAIVLLAVPIYKSITNNSYTVPTGSTANNTSQEIKVEATDPKPSPQTSTPSRTPRYERLVYERNYMSDLRPVYSTLDLTLEFFDSPDEMYADIKINSNSPDCGQTYLSKKVKISGMDQYGRAIAAINESNCALYIFIPKKGGNIVIDQTSACPQYGSCAMDGVYEPKR